MRCEELSLAHLTTHTQGEVVLPTEDWHADGLLATLAEIAKNLVNKAVSKQVCTNVEVWNMPGC